MEIIIGAPPSIGVPFPEKTKANNSGLIEATLLNVRQPRRGIAGPSGMERRGKKSQDPVKGRVLTIMVPDGASLPKDIDTGNYRVMLRFSKR